jgi:nicotinate phosphoribosyltransferase
MAHAYFELGMRDTAVFELFVRRLPGTRRYLVAAGLEQAVEYLENLRFTDSDMEFLAEMGIFPTRRVRQAALLRRRARDAFRSRPGAGSLSASGSARD